MSKKGSRHVSFLSWEGGGLFIGEVACVFLICSYNLPEPSEEEKAKLEKKRTDKSMFVQELLLSTLAYLDSSSSSSSSGSEDSDHEQT